MKKLGFVTLSLLLVLSITTFAVAMEQNQHQHRNNFPCTQLKGEITDIIPADLQIIVDNVTVQVTTDTVITKDEIVISFEDLEIGMTVCVCGTYDGDILVAKKIKVKDCSGGCGEVYGDITSIDPVEKQIVVDDVTIQVTADTKIHKKWQILTFEDLEVGMTVCVEGEYQGTILIATKISVCGCSEGLGIIIQHLLLRFLTLPIF